jgi:hypothetical protein
MATQRSWCAAAGAVSRARQPADQDVTGQRPIDHAGLGGSPWHGVTAAMDFVTSAAIPGRARSEIPKSMPSDMACRRGHLLRHAINSVHELDRRVIDRHWPMYAAKTK